MEAPHGDMKLRAKSSGTSPIKISSKQLITFLIFLNLLVILLLLPIYRKVITSPSSLRDDSRGKVFQARISERLLRSEQPLPLLPPRPQPEFSSINSSVPHLSDEEFSQKYGSKYHGILPSRSENFPDPICGTNPDFFGFFVLPKSERSRFHEDKILYDAFFKNLTIPSPGIRHDPPLPKGTYVELGAFTGKEESNTMFFDRCLGWPGLLIEAQPQSYEKVVENRPNAIKLSFSPTCENDNETAALYNYPLSNNGMEGLAQSYIGKTTIQVPCGPLTPVLLDIFGPSGYISFLSLDVEGAEMMVLKTIDFGKLNIDVLMVEVQNTYCPTGNCPVVHQIRKTLAMTAKYALFTDLVEASDVYVRVGTDAHRRIRVATKEKAEWEKRMREAQMNLYTLGQTKQQ
mmetsp:Transcript_12312/g.25229  ORF Transcript_12312/g.25229 Transcript_12312/m.25229 type:complete len:402 (-) Transcript_12312:245-1450(-)